MTTNTHKGTLFIVDDEVEFRASIQEALEEAGYFVLTASEGNEALVHMSGISGPALAIVDLHMPGMNGWQLISTMRATKGLDHIPILVVTSRIYETVKGANRTLRKPVPLKKLLQNIKELIHLFFGPPTAA
jgi:CheY-like chemotaxis protein